jgi:hypothetical protein
MSKSYTGIDVIACVQGNTARSFDSVRYNDGSVKEHRDCVVLNFRGMTSGSSYSDGNETTRRRANARKKAARARARKVRILRTALAAFILISVVFGIGGIASRAKSKEVPTAYKYYDTITVAYEENLLDIVQRYDDRNFYKTQNDYLEELCRINNLDYDKSSYPVVTPGTHLVVPYYSTELK